MSFASCLDTTDAPLWSNMNFASVQTNIPISGTDAASIQGFPVSATTPLDEQVLQYSTVASAYVPTTISGGGSLPGDVVLVSTIDDFPAPVGNQITLESNRCYLLTTIVDIAGFRLVTGTNSSLIGYSYLCSGLTSSVGVGAMLTITSDCFVSQCSFIASPGLDGILCNTSPSSLVFIDKCIFTSCLAGIQMSSNQIDTLICNYCRFESCVNAINFASITAFSIILSFCQYLGCLTSLEGSPTISNRLTVNNSLFQVNLAEVGCNIDTVSSNIPTEGLIFDANVFSGNGTYLEGTHILQDDDRARYVDNRGINNSFQSVQQIDSNNISQTSIPNTTSYHTINVPNSTTAPLSKRFTGSNSSITYTGPIAKGFAITLNTSITPVAPGGQNDSLLIALSRSTDLQNPFSIMRVTTDNTTRPVSCSLTGVIELTQGESVSAVVRNTSGAEDMIFSSFQLTAVTISA